MKNLVSAQTAIRILGLIMLRMLDRQINEIEKHCDDLICEGDVRGHKLQTAKLKSMKEDHDRLSMFLDEGGVL